MESVSIEIRENERCPAGLEILINQPKFTVNLNPKGGVGDFEILNSRQEVVIIGQKHLSTISLLENTSRSEVLTLDLTDISEMSISCPPTDEIAMIRNTRMGLFQPNTLEIESKAGSHSNTKQFNFKFLTQQCKSSRGSDTEKQSEGDQDAEKSHNFQVVDDGSVVVAEIFVSRLSSCVSIRLPGNVPLSPVQAAVIFGGLAFQIYSIKKQKSMMALLTMGALLLLILIIIIVYVLAT